MTEGAMHQNGGASPAGEGDPELARICELRDAMALSPRELIAKLKSEDAIGVAEHAADGETTRGQSAAKLRGDPSLGKPRFDRQQACKAIRCLSSGPSLRLVYRGTHRWPHHCCRPAKPLEPLEMTSRRPSQIGIGRALV